MEKIGARGYVVSLTARLGEREMFGGGVEGKGRKGRKGKGRGVEYIFTLLNLFS